MRIYFWKITTQRKFSIKNDTALQLLQISFMFNLTEDSWILSQLPHTICCDTCFDWTTWETAPHKYAVRKRKYIILLISFSENYGCSLILHQSLISRQVCGLAIIWNWISHKLSVFCYRLSIGSFTIIFGILITLKILFHRVIVVQSPSHVNSLQAHGLPVTHIAPPDFCPSSCPLSYINIEDPEITPQQKFTFIITSPPIPLENS